MLKRVSVLRAPERKGRGKLLKNEVHVDQWNCVTTLLPRAVDDAVACPLMLKLDLPRHLRIWCLLLKHLLFWLEGHAADNHC